MTKCIWIWVWTYIHIAIGIDTHIAARIFRISPVEETGLRPKQAETPERMMAWFLLKGRLCGWFGKKIPGITTKIISRCKKTPFQSRVHEPNLWFREHPFLQHVIAGRTPSSAEVPRMGDQQHGTLASSWAIGQAVSFLKIFVALLQELLGQKLERCFQSSAININIIINVLSNYINISSITSIVINHWSLKDLVFQKSSPFLAKTYLSLSNKACLESHRAQTLGHWLRNCPFDGQPQGGSQMAWRMDEILKFLNGVAVYKFFKLFSKLLFKLFSKGSWVFLENQRKKNTCTWIQSGEFHEFHETKVVESSL